VASTITGKGLPPALERAQADTDLAAGTNQTSASGMASPISSMALRR
jgi:hypothetical protein